eukprot:gene3117-3395_t
MLGQKLGSGSLPLLAFQHHVGSLYITPEEIEFICALGTGDLALVEQGRWHRADGSICNVVVKGWKPDVIATPQDFRELLLEASKLHRLQHPNITRFLGLGCFCHATLAEVRESMFMVEEYVGTRTIRKLISSQMRCRIKNLYNMQTALRWAAEVAAALTALHDEQPAYIHGDVKADNIFLTDDSNLAHSQAKIGDLKPHRYCLICPKLSRRSAAELGSPWVTASLGGNRSMVDLGANKASSLPVPILRYDSRSNSSFVSGSLPNNQGCGVHDASHMAGIGSCPAVAHAESGSSSLAGAAAAEEVKPRPGSIGVTLSTSETTARQRKGGRAVGLSDSASSTNGSSAAMGISKAKLGIDLTDTEVVYNRWHRDVSVTRYTLSPGSLVQQRMPPAGAAETASAAKGMASWDPALSLPLMGSTSNGSLYPPAMMLTQSSPCDLERSGSGGLGKSGAPCAIESKQHGSNSAFAALTAIDCITEETSSLATDSALETAASGQLESSGGVAAKAAAEPKSPTACPAVSTPAAANPGAYGSGDQGAAAQTLPSSPRQAGGKRVRFTVERPAGATPSRDFGLLYAAPELVRGYRPTEKVDVFAFGVLLFELLSRQLVVSQCVAFCQSGSRHSRRKLSNNHDAHSCQEDPLPRDNSCDSQHGIETPLPEQQLLLAFAQRVAEGARLPFPEHFPQPVRDLISACWASEPHERPRMAEVLAQVQAVAADRHCVALLNSYVAGLAEMGYRMDAMGGSGAMCGCGCIIS